MRKTTQIILSILGVIALAIFYALMLKLYSDLSESASIIEALLAPIIGVAGIILVYISFREQVRANKIQSQALSEQRELDLFYKFYEELKTDLQRIQSEYGTKYGQPSILDSMMNYILQDKKPPYDELNEYIVYLFNQFVFITKRTERTKFLNDSEILYFIEKTRHLYNLYFGKYFTITFINTFKDEFVINFKNDFSIVDSAMARLVFLHNEKKEKIRKSNS